MGAPMDAGAGRFHAGERAAQARYGLETRMAEIAARVIRGAMPAQHREFFEQLPFVALGSIDAAGQPWATLLAGAPGFVRSPDPTTLRVGAWPAADDPLAPLLRAGAPLALLGIELPTRRRNRANGRIAAVDAQGFELQVEQSFGNCPKYIQRRDPVRVDTAPGAARRGAGLDAPMRALLRRADTFFVATHASGSGGGADVSHRGGRPGFVAVEGDTLGWPEYPGNMYFNTLGNLLVRPRAGLVLPDFETGDLLHLAGRTEVAWQGDEPRVRLQVDAAVWRPGAWPLRAGAAELSPALEDAPSW